MKRLVVFCSLIILICLSTNAQIKYYDAKGFPLLGKITDQTETRYERLSAGLKNVSRARLWQLGKNTAGLALRFRTNAKTIAAKWNLNDDAILNHMASVGVKGVDLYCLNNGKWQFVNSGKPTAKNNVATIISNMKGEEREYMLYLPLYDGISSLEIGVDSLAMLMQPKVNSPILQKPIVYYGTSITQGGCASRPGMAHTNILSRMLNREVINLGFSGNGQLDSEIAEMMTGYDASLFILDFMPNVDAKMIKEKAEKFFDTLRSKSPMIPILVIENPIFPYSEFDLVAAQQIEANNNELRNFFKSRVRKGDKNIYLITADKIIGSDGEATVDGIHFTDLGFKRCADYLYSVIKSGKYLPSPTFLK